MRIRTYVYTCNAACNAQGLTPFLNGSENPIGKDLIEGVEETTNILTIVEQGPHRKAKFLMTKTRII